ncbi:putative indolepyruvate ferredoxin oxidoreductase, subunit B [Variovorax paradoxus B4]|uniref:Putative indolepyruvate ferredoxin oxidoreductase, subunit B n=1 Tax=Variovorax paradoxus B4 TaxID=1246301 RepID=T1XG90_VARPD|nr:indolepyruvate oxidoreductase subunit beta family protein [Variovorax paradoxus]AGU51115.1 putative indolepyruvate ferredoxin oxidoreductase, subunit B [Variovorax paradoxus B4]
MEQNRPISLLVCALGGEGGGVLTEWLVDIARHAGHAAQSTSIPGVAQRTGATTYYIEVFPVPLVQLAGRRPVFSLSPVPGALDAIVSSELLETARQIGNGMSAPLRTLVISSSARIFTTAERMQPGDGRADAQRLVDVVKAFSREHHVFDMNAMARETGTVVSAVMLGAIAGSGLFPFPREAYEHVVRGGDARAPEKLGKMAAASLRGFAAGFEAVGTPRAQAAFVSSVLAADTRDAPPPPRALPDELARRFPPAVHDMLTLGHARVLDYQDAGYAALYADRLGRVLDAERAADPAGAQGFAITREIARWLALWMAFDDIVRVAALKGRASRAQRVRQEVRAAEEDIVKVYDHFKPGAAEFAALLPAGLARRVTAWDRGRQARGLAPWALPLQVGSHSVAGMASLRLLSSLKWLRRRGHRFAEEQALIERWLAAVEAGTREAWVLGHELALCGRLIKGYGSTNERGKHNLLHMIGELAGRATLPAPARAEAIAAAREAALADEGGKALDAALVRHGAAPRPVQAQPIRWMKRPPSTTARP